jgi:hypothetical protein
MFNIKTLVYIELDLNFLLLELEALYLYEK